MENLKPVLVVGSTGFLGTEICRKLVAQNKKVRALVRSTSDPFKVKALSELGVETVNGDIKEPSSLSAAFSGIGAVISTASSTISQQPGDSIESVDRKGQLQVVEAARTAGVEKFVFISFLQSGESFPLQDAKRAVEESLKTSGMNYTILRPSFFMEVWLGPHLGFDPLNGKATVYGRGENKISWIRISDVARYAVASLDNPVAKNKTIELGGPEALSPLEVISLFEKRAGRKFEVQFVPEEALRAQMEGPSDPLQRSFTALMLTYAAGAEIPMEQTAMDFNLEPASLETYCETVLQQQVTEESTVTF